MTAIATRCDRVFAVDAKGENIIPNALVAWNEAAAAKAITSGAHRIVYVPHRSEMPRLPAIVDRLVSMLIERGAWCYVFHELGDIADENRCPPAVGELYRKGAAAGNIVLAAYQRTVGLPRLVASQSAYVFLFAVYDHDELDRAAAMMGAAVRLDPLPLPFTYECYVRGPDGSLIRVDQRRRTARSVAAGSTARPTTV